MNAPALNRIAPAGSPLDDRSFRAVYEFLSFESDCLCERMLYDLGR